MNPDIRSVNSTYSSTGSLGFDIYYDEVLAFSDAPFLFHLKMKEAFCEIGLVVKSVEKIQESKEYKITLKGGFVTWYPDMGLFGSFEVEGTAGVIKQVLLAVEGIDLVPIDY